MKRIPLWLLTPLLCLPVPTLAQTAPSSDLSSLAGITGRLPRYERLEGTIAGTGGGVTSRARLQFQAPDQLRIDVQPDDAALIAAHTVIATGEETRIFYPTTKRVQRLAHNVARQPWRGWSLQHGGPANVVLFGLAPPGVTPYYTPTVAPWLTLSKASSEERLALQLKARPDAGQYLIRDFVRTGGVGDQMFYAAYKRRVFDRPAQLAFGFDTKTNRLFSRLEMDQAERKLTESTLTLDAASGLPTSVTTRDATNNVAAEFTYDLKKRTEPFPAATFTFDSLSGAVIEDQELRPIAVYEAGTDADSRFNLGVALARHAEDFPAAFAAWEDAARLQPQAVAPHFQTYDLALRARDLVRARKALDQLAQLMGQSDFEVVTREAGLATLRRDGAGATTALEAAQKAQPKHLGVTLLRADLARGRGDYAAARELLLGILKSDAPQRATQIAAAEMLAAVVFTPSNRKAAEEALAGLPRDTEWQRLARGILGIWLGKGAGDVTLQHPAARVALAVAREQEPDKAMAPVLAPDFWTTIARQEPQPLARLARLLGLGRAARNGDVAASLAAYRELIADAPDESSRDDVRDSLLNAWFKANRLEQLRTVLQQRLLATGAGEDEARLWLAYHSAYGVAEGIEAALQSGMARYPKSAWWQSQWAEKLMGEAFAQPPTTTGVAARNTIIRNALRHAQKAAATEPTQPYYPTQHALILAQQATMRAAVIDPAQFVAQRKAALDALAALQQAWKDDPDVEIAVAIQRLALEPPMAQDEAIRLLQKALRGGNPGRETTSGDRHEAAFIARQALAGTLREMKKPQEAARQFEIALASARSAGEEFGIAANLINLLISRQNTAAIPELLVRLAQEPWPFEQHQQLMDGVIRVVLRSRPLAQEVSAGLKALNTPYAHLVLMHFNKALLPSARAGASTPNAPLAADTFLRTTTRDLATALQALQTAAGDDKVLAGHTAVLLGDDAFTRKNFTEAVKWMRAAVEAEPGAVGLRVALATAYLTNGQTKEATAVRDDIVRALPRTVENLRQASVVSSRLQLQDDVLRFASQAMNLAQSSPDVPLEQWQAATFTVARTALAAGQTLRAQELYNNLAAAQWSMPDRVAALIDAEQRMRAAGRSEQATQAAEKLRALNATPQDLSAARQFLAGLD